MAIPQKLQSRLEDLYHLSNTTVGARLFTVTTVDPADQSFARIYSNLPDAYPVYGRKPADETEWSKHVLVEKQTFVANDYPTLRALFPDHALIRSLGCESILNLPIVQEDKVIGTINLLHEAGYYTEQRVADSRALHDPAAVCIVDFGANFSAK